MRPHLAGSKLRSAKRSLSARDLAALRCIGEGYEVAQYQLHEAVFLGRSPTVVSRFVLRAAEHELIVRERQDKIGMNRLRLTARGRGLLVDQGVAHPDELFAPRASVALKDVAHTRWINDLRVAVMGLSPAPDLALPAWALQRRLQPTPAAIPDLLAIWKDSASQSDGVLAAEIDLGGEGMKVFLPKLDRLADLVSRWAGSSRGQILVLCRGRERRRGIVREASQMVAGLPQLSLHVEILPEEPGRDSIRLFTSLLTQPPTLAIDRSSF